MYENSSQRPLSRQQFIRRLMFHAGLVVLLILGSLTAGILGYVHFEGLSPADAFLHTAMLLGGLGLVETPSNTAAKLFAGLFALYSGLVFLAAFGIILAPVLHRILHKFHWAGDKT